MGTIRIGFDIGTSDLKVVQRDGSGNIRHLAAEIMPDNLVREGQIVSFEAMSDFVREIGKKHRLSGRDCGIILPAGLTYLRRLTMPAMTVDQLKFNLPYEFRDYITMEKDKYFYDYAVNEILTGEDGQPKEMDLTAAAVSKETISEYAAMFRRAGFRLKAAAPVECAYSNLLRAHEQRNPEEKGREYCILDLGYSSTRIYIFTGSRFETTRIIEIGCGTVDSAIADTFHVDEHVARTYKDSNHEGAQELETARSVYNHIAVEIMKAINFYGFNNRESNLEHAYYCGGGSKIAPLIRTIGETVHLELHKIEELMPPVEENAEESALCAAALGITLQ